MNFFLLTYFDFLLSLIWGIFLFFLFLFFCFFFCFLIFEANLHKHKNTQPPDDNIEKGKIPETLWNP